MSNSAFALFETELVDVRRLPVMSGSPPMRDVPAALASDIACLPFMPASKELLARTRYDEPGWPMETYTEYEVHEGDELVRADGTVYQVFYAAPWPWASSVTVYQVGIRKPFEG